MFAVQKGENLYRGAKTKGKRFAFRSLAAFLAALSLFSLAACANTDASRMETPTVSAEPSTTIEESTITPPGLDEEANDIIEKYKEMENSPNYYLDYYKTITDEDVQELVNRMGIIYSDIDFRISRSGAMFIRDLDGVIKPIPMVFVPDEVNDKIEYFYLNGIKLFEIPFYTPEVDTNTGLVKNFPFSKMTKKLPYLEKIEIHSIGIQGSYILFSETFKEELRNQSSIYYKVDGWSLFEVAYNGKYNDDMNTTIGDIAKSYARFVPQKHHVYPSTLLQDYEYTPESKFLDCWVISSEEMKKRIEDIGATDLETKFPMSAVQKLVFEDEEGKRKLRDVLLSHQGNILKVIDFPSRLELFEVSGVQSYTLNKDTSVFENINYDNIQNAIPFFDDKKVIKICAYSGTTDFYNEEIDYFRNKDGIDYEDVSSFADFISCPHGTYNTDDMYLPAIFYIKRYCSIPEEDIVPLEELTMGLDIDLGKSK